MTLIEEVLEIARRYRLRPWIYNDKDMREELKELLQEDERKG